MWWKRLTSCQNYNKCFLFKSIISDKIQFNLAQETKKLISFSGFSLSFSIFSVEIEDVFPAGHQMNQIFCYICLVITYCPAHMQAIKRRGTKSGFRRHLSALVQPQTMWDDFSSISSYLLEGKMTGTYCGTMFFTLHCYAATNKMATDIQICFNNKYPVCLFGIFWY